MGKAKRLAQEDYGYSVQVRGDRNYRVDIYLDYNDRLSRLVCNCDEAKGGSYCQHMAAALHYTEDCLQEKIYLSEALENLCAKANEAAAGKATKERKPAASASAKLTPEEKRSQKLQKTYREGIEQLSAMQEAMEKERENDETAGGAKSTEAYSYFRVDNFRNVVTITKDALARAQRLLLDPNITCNIKVGFFDLYEGYSYASYPSVGSTVPDELRIQATLIDKSRKTRLAIMFFDKEGPIRSQCDDWSCPSRRYAAGRIGHSLCPHEAALLLSVENNIRSNPVGDFTNRSGIELFDSFGINANSARAGIAKPSSLRLVPQIRLDSYGDWSILFKVGAGRLYKVSKLQEFCKDVAAGKEEKYGSSTFLQLSEEAFDENSKKWLAFLRQAIHILAMFSGISREARGDVYYYDSEQGWNRVTDRLPLSGEILDRLFETAGDEPVSFEQTGDNRKKGNVTMKEADFRPSLTVSPFYSTDRRSEFEGVKLTGALPHMLHGSSGCYFLEGDYFYRISRQTETAIEPLLRNADSDGNIEIRIGRRRLTDFWRKILPQLQEISELKIETPETIEQYLPAEPVFIAYLDVQDGVVLCRPEVYYGSLRHTPFDVYAWKERKAAPQGYRD
ncbi:MAG: SNF2 helicase associated domain-containing protein, partial [bacterium]